MSENEDNAAAVLTNTARLRAIRLARDAQEQAAPAATTTKRSKKAAAAV
jgi:hypothetical protein